jgi:fructokinase
LGGGVSQHPGFHEAVCRKVRKYLNGYIQSPMVADNMDEYILPPVLGNRSGALGAIAMAIQLAEQMKLTADHDR